MEYLFLTIVLGLLGLLLAYHVRLHHVGYGKFINEVAGPTVLPLFGNLLSLHVPLAELHSLMRKWAKNYYPSYRIWFGNKGTIHIFHPDDVEILLTSSTHINKDFTYEFMRPWLKTGLLTSWAQKWHKRRKILTPAFHFNILKRYMEITNEQIGKAVTNLRAKEREIKVDLLPFCSEYTLNIICESAMGVALDRGEDRESAVKYKNAIYDMGKLIFYRCVRPYIKDWMIPFMPALNRECKETYKHLDEFVDKIVQDRREYHHSTGYKDLKQLEDAAQENVYIGKRKRLAMLDLLLDAERNGLIDDAGIKEEVATFVFEGHDTTAMGLCYTIMLFAENVEAQNRAREEVVEILKRKSGVLDNSDLQEMSYLERCIKESLRIMPSVPSITRHMTEGLQMKHSYAPKGSDVAIHFIDLHRDPNFWPDPFKFDPDRFLPENSRNRHPFSYLPFSAGPRNCIGQKFAMMELKSLIARILYNFNLEPVDRTSDVKMLLDVVLRPDHSLYTKFIRIDRT